MPSPFKIVIDGHGDIVGRRVLDCSETAFFSYVALCKLEEDVRRFRARRRVCWIGQRDPASTLYCLPTEILRKLVPYFALE